MKTCGPYQISTFNFGMFRLDGGAMFGSVPKNLWSKSIPADQDNCISLATRCLVLRGNGKVAIIDVGMGEKWSEKQRSIYGVANTEETSWPITREEVTDVILTHLHFDHAGGITRYLEDSTLVPSFPNAQIHLQKSHWEYAHNPSLKDKASYISENIAPLSSLPLLLHDGPTEILPSVWAHPVHGHTKGQQWIEVRGNERSILVTTDVVPTSHHIPLPYHMGYDLCAETILREKEAFLEFALRGNHILFFEHDPEIEAVTVTKNDKGKFTVSEKIVLG
jgi:glyoxylase-like metal-dependent hydrolase (beta-lactamase superfamily II)